jgi:nicotinamidase-related amidase
VCEYLSVRVASPRQREFARLQERNMDSGRKTGKMKKEALLIIDIQNDYFEEGANPLTGSLEASLNAQKLLEYYRKKSLPVIHIQHLSVRAGSTFFIPDTKGAEFHQNVLPQGGEKVVIKNCPNSFRETDLLEYLQSNRITDLVICGMMTHMCVDATTRAAKDFGFSCTLISDTCATKNLEIQGETVAAKEVQNSFLAALSYFYATVLTVQEYLEKENRRKIPAGADS